MPPSATRRSTGGAIALTLVALATGCGGDDATSSTDAATTSRTAGAATDVDAEITRLVRVRGGRLDTNARKLFGDRAQLEDFDTVRAVAATRAAIAAEMRGAATQDAGTLARLAGSARTTSNVVAPAGRAFVGFENCGRLGMSFFGDLDPDRSGRALREAGRICNAARAAYAAARAELRRVSEPGTTTQATAGAGALLVIGNHAADDPTAQALVRDAAPGSSVRIVFRGRDVGSVPADLRKECAGPLTFTVTLTLTGSPALDLTSGGYSDTGQKTRVPARITGKSSFELGIGTFDVPAGAGGVSRLIVVPSAASCPDRETGAAHAPTFSTGITDTLVLRVRR